MDELGVDDQSLRTTMWGITTEHYETYKRVQDAESLINSKNGSNWARISAIAAIIAAVAAFISIFK